MNIKSVLFIRYVANIIVGQFLRVFWVVPVKKNRIIFSSAAGRQYSCNPKYIYEELTKKYPDIFEVIWVLDEKHNAPPDTICVKRNSIPYCFYMLTSKVIIDNNGFNAFMPYRKTQLKINTWHAGGAYKKAGIDSDLPDMEYRRLAREGKVTDIVLSSCRRFSEVFPTSYRISPEAVRGTGLPRNDIMFQDARKTKLSVYEKLGLQASHKLVIYAPTFRGQSVSALRQDYTIDVEQCLEELGRRFGGDWVMGFRMHHVYHKEWQNMKNSISLCEYQDMQELLVAADVLITDYSSSMWDFSLLCKPCFVYAPDLERYQSTVDFYTPVSEWPFPVAKNNGELVENIQLFEEASYENAVQVHHKMMGSYEKGDASQLLSVAIYDYCLGNISKKEFLKQNMEGKER